MIVVPQTWYLGSTSGILIYCIWYYYNFLAKFRSKFSVPEDKQTLGAAFRLIGAVASAVLPDGGDANHHIDRSRWLMLSGRAAAGVKLPTQFPAGRIGTIARLGSGNGPTMAAADQA